MDTDTEATVSLNAVMQCRLCCGHDDCGAVTSALPPCERRVPDTLCGTLFPSKQVHVQWEDITKAQSRHVCTEMRR